MKKITLLIMIASLPFFTIAQKRGKKPPENSKALNILNNSDFMIITYIDNHKYKKIDKKKYEIEKAKKAKTISKQSIFCDFGDGKIPINKIIPDVSSASDAINKLSKFGWEFHSSNTINYKESIMHYYYLKKK